MRIVVFGSSTCDAGSALYSTAEALGSGLAQAGFDVVNGGYSGTMEAVSKGASSQPSVTVTGVIVPELFPGRPPRGNAFLNDVAITHTLMERLTKLVSDSEIFIALPGSVGTLAELVLVWNHINIDFRVNHTSTKHLILWREPFERFILDTVRSLGLKPIDTENIHFVDTPTEAVAVAMQLSA